MWCGKAKGCATSFDGPANAEPDAISRGWQRLIALGQLGALVRGEKLLDDDEAALLQRRPVSRGLHASVRGPSEREPQLPTLLGDKNGLFNDIVQHRLRLPAPPPRRRILSHWQRIAINYGSLIKFCHIPPDPLRLRCPVSTSCLSSASCLRASCAARTCTEASGPAA